MMRRSLPTLLALAILALTATAAMAERKLAFVAGINAYSNLPEDKQLERAVSDATAVAAKLRGMGFQVTEVTSPADSTQRNLLRRFSAFKNAIEPGDMVLFFFSGHGVAFGSNNFLLPADIPEPGPDDERLVQSNSIAETDLIDDIRERGARLTLMIIDACRDNPFPKPGKKTIGATRGLAIKEPAEGVLSIYSAGAGQTALDKLTRDRRDTVSDPNPNSVFTRVLLREIDKPGQNLVDLGETLREEVAALAKTVQHKQVPAVYNQTLGARQVFLGPPVKFSPIPVVPRPIPEIVTPAPPPAPRVEPAARVESVPTATAAPAPASVSPPAPAAPPVARKPAETAVPKSAALSPPPEVSSPKTSAPAKPYDQSAEWAMFQATTGPCGPVMLAAIERYRKAFPDGAYASLVRGQFEKCAPSQARSSGGAAPAGETAFRPYDQRAEWAMFQATIGACGPIKTDAVERYLREYPDGAYRSLVDGQLSNCPGSTPEPSRSSAQMAEDAALSKAQRAEWPAFQATVGACGPAKIAAVEDYRRDFPNGAYKSLVEDQFAKCRTIGRSSKASSLGIEVAPIDHVGVPGSQGLVVTEVAAGGSASGKLEKGDLILKIADFPVTGASDLTSQYDRALREGRTAVYVMVQRDGKIRFFPIPVKKG